MFQCYIGAKPSSSGKLLLKAEHTHTIMTRTLHIYGFQRGRWMITNHLEDCSTFKHSLHGG
jgi:hypothetical protein